LNLKKITILMEINFIDKKKIIEKKKKSF
jgi:hypothetical protein